MSILPVESEFVCWGEVQGDVWWEFTLAVKEVFDEDGVQLSGCLGMVDERSELPVAQADMRCADVKIACEFRGVESLLAKVDLFSSAGNRPVPQVGTVGGQLNIVCRCSMDGCAANVEFNCPCA